MVWVDDWLMAVALVALLGGAAAVVAWLLRRSAVPGGVQGAAVCAGVFVGLLAGPGVAALAWPDWYARWVTGGVQESRDLLDLREQQRDEVAALRAVGVTPVAVDELEAKHRQDIELVERALQLAHAQREAWNNRGLVAAGALVAGVGVVCLRRRAARPDRKSLVAGLIVFGVGVALPWGVMGLIGLPYAGAFALAVGALSAGVGVVGLAPGAALVAALAAGGAAFWCFGAEIVPVVLATVIAAVARVFVPRGLFRRVRRGALDFLWVLGMPTLSALVALRLDLRGLDASLWTLWLTLVFALVWCSDGRMGAAWVALRVVRERRAWAYSARMVNAGALVPHMVFTAVGAGAGLLPQPALAALAASAVLLSLTVGARRLIAEMIESGGFSSSR